MYTVKRTTAIKHLLKKLTLKLDKTKSIHKKRLLKNRIKILNKKLNETKTTDLISAEPCNIKATAMVEINDLCPW